MAGESPDRSKQRESSARETSGSASPVPEARSESAADPRLAVARDTERSSARGGADTATRVLSTRTGESPKNTGHETGTPDTESTADDAEHTENASGDAERAENASGDAERAENASDAERAKGDPDAEGPADSSAGDAGRAGTGSDAEDPADAAAGDAERAEGSSDAEGAESGSGGKGADESAERGTDTEDDSGTESATEGSAGDAGRARSGSGAEDPADSSAGDAGRAEGSSDAEGAGSGSGGKDADESAERGTDTEDDSDAESATEGSAGDAGRAEGSDGRLRDAVAAWVASADGEKESAAEGDAEGQDSADEGDEPEADRSATGGSASGAKAGDEPADPRVSGKAEASAKTAPEDATPKKPDAKTPDAKGTDAKRTDSVDHPTAVFKAAPKASDDADDADDDAPAAPPVDQPTAVFKTLRPPVDQPTTMLKLGGAAKDLPKSDLPKKDAPKKDVPEKDAERTSKFVALKPLDDPAAKRPAPAEATAPVPTVGPERTTQQPLPPKPPLDLLAELTNTPPPPETPLRTAARRVKIWTPLVLLLIVVFAVVQSVRPLPSPTLELTAKDSYTFEGGKVDIPWPTDGQAALDVQGIGTFGSSGEQKPVPIASVAKVMTAYVILRDHPLKSGEDGPKILIDQAAEDQSDAGQESTVDVTKDDKITEREALESILIASANNVARLLARWDAGSEKAFVRKMNQAATDLGMKNTTYTDPSGLNNTTVSTAVDQVKLAKAAMLQPAFREVAAMMSYVDYKGKKHDNWNRLVGYNDVTGIKTGTTTSALGNLVFAAKKDVNGETHRIIGAVVRQPAGGPDNTILGAALHEGDKLIKAAQGALESATILKKGDVVGYADDGLGGRTPVAVTEDVTAVGWAGLSVKLTFAGDDLPHTAKAGTKVGTLTVGDGSSSAVKVPVALQKDLTEPGFGAKLTRLG
ncbi:D-alanyl-D-alanine carboxypeptidase [Streptomyces sp. NPDC007984]|uniref:D-alanyl-D-alanine carboxypeptidase n=1 Tax=Streptomyces sp. NPDC007984 TaxID=3364801 RepID=UPI0036E2CAD9